MMITQEYIGQRVQSLGNFAHWTGVFGIGAMAVVGTFAIDLVIIAAVLDNAKKNKSNQSNQTSDFFVTMMLWNMMSSKNSHTTLTDYLLLLLISPITSAIAIGLSFYLGVSSVGIAILGGWAASLSLVTLGSGLSSAGKWLENSPPLTETIGDAIAQTTGLSFFSSKIEPSAPPYEPMEIPMVYATPVM